jgi:AcrR family transcriptional regulator
VGKNTIYKIEKIAIKMFKERGYENTTIRDICEASGITKSTFFYHFKNKEQLLNHLYENITELSPKVLRLLAVSENSWEKIWTLIEPSIDWTEDVGVIIISQIVITDLQNRLDTLGVPGNSELTKLYIEIVRNGQAKGHFMNSSSPCSLVSAIKHVMCGDMINWCLAGGDYPYRETIREDIITLLQVDKKLLNN